MFARARAALDIAFPPDLTCIVCGGEREVSRGYSLCPRCAKALAPPELPLTPHHLQPCAAIDRAYTALAWQEESQKLIHRFKYRGESYLARNLAYLLRDALYAGDFRDIHALTPVPLHPRRRRERGYDQAVLLARELSFLTQIPWKPSLLRVRNTPHQVGKTAEQRAQNVREAFAPAPGANVCGQRLVLVDDVLTTGATARACAQVLKDMGAASICMLSACATAATQSGSSNTKPRMRTDERAT